MPDEGERKQNSWADCHPSLSLVGREFPPPEEFVSGFLTTGLTVIAASPKAGKTWLCHEFALSVAQGERALRTLPSVRADVLCLFLEDSLSRAIRREQILLGRRSGCRGITYAPAGSLWSIRRISRYLDEFPACRMIVVDTAERFKQQQSRQEGNGRVYSEDYAFWGAFQSLAIQRNVAIVVIHHDRKPGTNGGGGGIDSVSGTRAITGSADHIWILDRERETGISTLKIYGRDLEEGMVEFVRREDGRLAVVDAVREEERDERQQQAVCMKEGGMGLREIAEQLGVSKSTVSRWLRL